MTVEHDMIDVDHPGRDEPDASASFPSAPLAAVPPAGVSRAQMLIAAPRDHVFRVLADGQRYAEWVVGAKKIRSVDPGYPAPGTRLHHSVGAGALTIDDDTTSVEVEANRSLVLRASAGPLGEAMIRFELLDRPSGTLVVMDEAPVGDDMRAAVGRSARRALQARNAETLWQLKSIVEHDGQAHQDPSSSAHPAAALPQAVATITARTFGWLSGLRGERIFHPKGVALSGTAHVLDAGLGLADGELVDVIVRFSRGLGLPAPMPDVHGIAVKLLNAHGEGFDQDLLFASSLPWPVARHVLMPTPTFMGTFGSILPYRAEDGLVMFATDAPPVATIGDLYEHPSFTMRLRAASPFGSWRDVLSIDLRDVVKDDAARSLRFDPWHTTDQLLPMGALNRLRQPAYAASQASRLS